MLRPTAITTLLAALFFFAVRSSAQDEQPVPGMPTSGGYKPPALSLDSLLRSDKTISNAVMAYAGSGDSAAFRQLVESAAASGDITAELLLAEQYIPEQCAHEPDRDVPACGPDGKQPPHVVFRANPLKVPASYESATQWLEKASGQGSAKPVKSSPSSSRMLANGHSTTYTAADSTRLHALALRRSLPSIPLSRRSHGSRQCHPRS